MNKVSFDFDGTLTKPCIQKLAHNLIRKGYEVFIITSRRYSGYGVLYDNSDLYEVSDRIGIKRCNIIFTQMNFKFKFIDTSFIFHIDDDVNELDRIKNIPTIYVKDKFCIRKCYAILNECKGKY